jgi:diguanylate cyclase
VSELVKSNGRMQSQLADYEGRLKEQSRQIEEHASEARTDPLTGLANRRAFDEEISRRFAEFERHGRPFSLIFIDVDHFKKFNDAHGHQAGDQALRCIAKAIQDTVRAMDVVARYGGEEFAVVYPGISIRDAITAAERCRHAIEAARLRWQESDLSVTASIGVAEIAPGEHVAALIRRADESQYEAKDGGRNATYWHDGQTIRPAIPPEEPPAPADEPADQQTLPEQPEGESGPSQSSPPPESPSDTQRTVRNRLMLMESELDRSSGRSTFCQLLKQRIAEWKRGGARFSVILASIDGYEWIAESHGRTTAELVHRTTCRFFEAALRDMDTLARYGPGCYALLLPNSQLADNDDVAKRLRRGLAQCIVPVKDAKLRLSLSLSVTEVVKGDEWMRLLERAESALADAQKAAGRQRRQPPDRETSVSFSYGSVAETGIVRELL